MRSLLSFYKDIFDNGEWIYYNQMRNHEFPLISEIQASDFIKSYFITGGKEIVFPDYFIKNCIPRSNHILSTFFLGILLKRIVPKHEAIQPHFLHAWYLTCLFHDIGYFIETNNNYSSEKYDLSKINSEFNIRYKILRRLLYKPYTSKIIKRYYDYCRIEKNFINHGIIGGILLYDGLRKNHQMHEDNARRIGIDVNDPGGFSYLDLHWSPEHRNWYLKAALNIIAHNIWFCTNRAQRNTYKKYGIEELIIPPAKKITNKKASLLYLLCLVDTIEPTKVFWQIDPMVVLDKISVEISNNNIKLKVDDPTLDYSVWFKKIKSLNKWINIMVRQRKNILYITIT